MAETTIDVLNMLDQSKGYDIALLTTFNLDVDFFEKAVLNRLLKNGVKDITLFADAKEFTKSLKEVQYTSLGKKYIVNPVTMAGSYHPKIILLLGEDKARLIIGSGNLTLSGYYINNELFDCIDYSSRDPQNRYIIVDAINYILNSIPFTPNLDEELMGRIKKKIYYRPAEGNGALFFLGNGERSILSQAASLITGKVTGIRVVVPYYDNGLGGLDSLHRLFPDASMQLYIQQGKSTFRNREDRRYIKGISIFEKINVAGKQNNHFYHGKAFLFETENNDYFLYGSANCTQSALTKTPDIGGNFECDLLIKGTVNQFDDFFGLFAPVSDQQLISNPMYFENLEKANYYFKYGILDNILTLHIGYNVDFAEVSFRYGKQELSYLKREKEIIIEIPENLVRDSLIRLEIEYKGTLEELPCWYIDRKAILLFREDTRRISKLEDSVDFAEGEEYEEDIILLLQEMGSCIEDYKKRMETMGPILSVLEEDKEANQSETDEDFIINIPLKDEDFYEYRQYKVVESLRNRQITKFLQGKSLTFAPGRLDEMQNGKISSQNERYPKRSVKNSRFLRVMRRTVRDAQNKEFAEMVSEDHFLGLVAIICNGFERNKDENLFSQEYVLESQCKLVELLVNKLSHDRDDINTIISRILKMILDNHEVIGKIKDPDRRFQLEQANRRILINIDNVYHLKSTYTDYFDIEPILSDTELRKKTNQNQQYLDSLYGYKDLSQIEKDFRKICQDLYGIQIEGSTAKIFIVSNKPEEYRNLNTQVIRDLANYSSNVKTLKRVQIEIRNPVSVSGKEITSIVHTISLSYHRWSYTVKRADGTKENSTSTYLSF